MWTRPKRTSNDLYPCRVPMICKNMWEYIAWEEMRATRATPSIDQTTEYTVESQMSRPHGAFRNAARSISISLETVECRYCGPNRNFRLKIALSWISGPAQHVMRQLQSANVAVIEKTKLVIMHPTCVFDVCIYARDVTNKSRFIRETVGGSWWKCSKIL